MAVLVGNLTIVGNPLSSLFFAHQPEPDLEFTEEELEQTTNTPRPIYPVKMPKKPGGKRPLFWILLLVLIGGAGYLAMEPEQVFDWIGQLLGQPSPTASTPSVANAPRPTPPAPPPIPPQPSAPPASDMAAPPPPTSAAPTAPPMPPLPPASPPAAAPASPVKAAASPMFAEGQKVTVVGDPTLPSQMIVMTLDPAGTRPGPSIRPGSTLNILDGDLQPSGWIYSVRADDGTKGWVPERRLRLKF